METSSPVQGRLRGRTGEELVMTGISPNYREAKETGALRIEYREEGEQLDHRAGRHVAGFTAILAAYNQLHPEKPVEVSGLPTYAEIMDGGLGAFLAPPGKND